MLTLQPLLVFPLAKFQILIQYNLFDVYNQIQFEKLHNNKILEMFMLYLFCRQKR